MFGSTELATIALNLPTAYVLLMGGGIEAHPLQLLIVSSTAPCSRQDQGGPVANAMALRQSAFKGLTACLHGLERGLGAEALTQSRYALSSDA